MSHRTLLLTTALLFIAPKVDAQSSDQNTAAFLEFVAGSSDALTSAGSEKLAELITARQLEEIQANACGRVSEQANAIAGFGLACPSLLSPLAGDLQECGLFGQPMAMRHLITVARHSASDDTCTAARVVGEQLEYAASLWAIEQWPTASEHPAYDSESGQRWDPRMMSGYAWSMGVRDADVQRILMDVSLALWAAESAVTLYDMPANTELLKVEADRGFEAVPNADHIDHPGAQARATACGAIRANLAELEALGLSDAVLAPLVLSTQVSINTQPYVPLCHLPTVDFSPDRMVELFSMLDTPTLRRAPDPFKSYAIFGASEYFTNWAVRSMLAGAFDDSVALGYLRAVDDLADHHIKHHASSDYNPDLEVPLNAQLLSVALRVLINQRAAPDYAALEPIVAPSFIASLYLMERDELRNVEANLSPDNATGEYAVELRTPETDWVTPWQTPTLGGQAVEGVVDMYKFGASAFSSEGPFRTFCKELEVAALSAEASEEERADIEEIVANYEAQAAVIADLRAANWADQACAESAGSAALPDGDTTVSWRVARSTYYMTVAFPELNAAVRSLIPGDGPNEALSPAAAWRAPAPEARTCVWTDVPASNITEALGYDRVGMLLHSHARYASQAQGSELRAYREAATRAYACEVAWLKANNLDDVADFVNQNTAVSGADACQRRRPVDIEPRRSEATGRVTYIAVRKYAHPLQRRGSLPEEQRLASVVANDVLGRALDAPFPLNECSAWELQAEGGRILVGVRMPAGEWVERREDGRTREWELEASPTWNPPGAAGIGDNVEQNGYDPEDLLDGEQDAVSLTRRSLERSATEDTGYSPTQGGSRSGWLVAAGIGSGITGVGLLTDGSLRLGRNITLYQSTIDTQSTLTPVQYDHDLQLARAGQAIGWAELAGGATLTAASVWCFASLSAQHRTAPDLQDDGIAMAAAWLPGTGGFLTLHTTFGGPHD